MQMISNMRILWVDLVRYLGQSQKEGQRQGDDLTRRPLLKSSNGLCNEPAATITFFALIRTSLCSRLLPVTFPSLSLAVHVPVSPTTFSVEPGGPSNKTSEAWNPSMKCAPAFAAAGNQLTTGPFFPVEAQPRLQRPQ